MSLSTLFWVERDIDELVGRFERTAGHPCLTGTSAGAKRHRGLRMVVTTYTFFGARCHNHDIPRGVPGRAGRASRDARGRWGGRASRPSPVCLLDVAVPGGPQRVSRFDGVLGMQGGFFVTPAPVPGLSGVSKLNPEPLGLTGITQVATSLGWNSAAVRSDGTLWTWGDNSDGELGIGNDSTLWIPEPVQVTALAGSARCRSAPATCSPSARPRSPSCPTSAATPRPGQARPCRQLTAPFSEFRRFTPRLGPPLPPCAAGRF